MSRRAVLKAAFFPNATYSYSDDVLYKHLTMAAEDTLRKRTISEDNDEYVVGKIFKIMDKYFQTICTQLRQ